MSLNKNEISNLETVTTTTDEFAWLANAEQGHPVPDCAHVLVDQNRFPSEAIFYRMLCPASEAYSQFYLAEESVVLQQFVDLHAAVKDMNFIVVGAGPLLHLSLGRQCAKRYIAVDELTDSFMQHGLQEAMAERHNITIINKYYEALTTHELPSENSLYVFTFNVISYIKDFVVATNRIIKQGDILFISYWNNVKENKDVINNYFNFVYDNENTPLYQPMFDADAIDYRRIKHFKEVQHIDGSIIKALVIYTNKMNDDD